MADLQNERGKISINHQHVFECFCGLLEDVRSCVCGAKQQLSNGLPMVKFCRLLNDLDLMDFLMYSTFSCLTILENREKLLVILRRILSDIESIGDSLVFFHEFLDKYFDVGLESGGADIAESAKDIA